LDFRLLEEEKILQYNPERSFLAHTFAVFEELFDAPGAVLLSLKDTLTAKCLRKGAQVYPMKTRVIIAVTNRDPAEIAEQSAAHEALIQRFPLQLEVRWPSHTAADYEELFSVVPQRGAKLNGAGCVLAQLLANLPVPVSPRTAVHAAGIACASAARRGEQEVQKEDLLTLRFLPGLAGVASELRTELEAAEARASAKEELALAKARMRQLTEGTLVGPIKRLQAAKRLEELLRTVGNLKVPDGLVEERNALRQRVTDEIKAAKEAAFDEVRV
jgi:hypothetical protein